MLCKIVSNQRKSPLKGPKIALNQQEQQLINCKDHIHVYAWGQKYQSKVLIFEIDHNMTLFPLQPGEKANKSGIFQNRQQSITMKLLLETFEETFFSYEATCFLKCFFSLSDKTFSSNSLSIVVENVSLFLSNLQYFSKNAI